MENECVQRYKVRGSYKVYFILGFIFIIPLIIGIVMLSKHLENLNLIKKGKDAIATPITYQTNITINNTPYYSITYEFEDDGCVYTGTTNTAYTYNQVCVIMHNNTLPIKYNPQTHKSIQSDYKSSTTFVIWILLGAGILGIFILLLGFAGLTHAKKMKEVLKLGEETSATYIDCNLTDTTYSYYSIKYSYQDKQGNLITKKTKGIYTYDEACYLEYLKQFKIKYYKKTSVITEDISNIIIRNYVLNIKSQKNSTNNSAIETKTESNSNAKKTKRCNFCGEEVDISKTKCPDCGSNSFSN